MPEQSRGMAKNVAQDVHDILIAVGTWKLEDREVHGIKRNLFSLDFKPVILNDRVAQDLVTGFIDLPAGILGICASQFDLEVFAHMHRADAPIAHVSQRVLHRLALRIQDGFFWRNNDFSFHRPETAKLVTGEQCDRVKRRKRANLVLYLFLFLILILLLSAVMLKSREEEDEKEEEEDLESRGRGFRV
jgi:hypothetical protein